MNQRIALTMLCDNHTSIGRYDLGEPAFFCLIEDGDQKILFDRAYSNTVSPNARRRDFPRETPKEGKHAQ